jgi:hypothetical protein
MKTINKSFTIEWLEPNRIFVITILAARLHKEDIVAIQNDTSLRYKSATQNLHVVIDLSNMENHTPQELQDSMRGFSSVTRENRGETIIIVSQDSPLVEISAEATMQGFRLPFHLCYSMEEAVKVLDAIEKLEERPTEPSHLAYSVSWYISNRVLLITVLGEISGDDLYRMASEAFSRIRKAPSVVHAIVDLRYLSKRPANLQMAFQDVWRHRHPNQGTSVIVTPMHPVAKFICTTVMGSLGLKAEFRNTFEEARDRITELEANRNSRV